MGSCASLPKKSKLESPMRQGSMRIKFGDFKNRLPDITPAVSPAGSPGPQDFDDISDNEWSYSSNNGGHNLLLYKQGDVKMILPHDQQQNGTD